MKIYESDLKLKSKNVRIDNRVYLMFLSDTFKFDFFYFIRQKEVKKMGDNNPDALYIVLGILMFGWAVFHFLLK